MKVLPALLVLLISLQAGFSQTISPDSLVLHLPFNGDAKDASSNHYDGVVNGATLTTGADNVPNTAYYFDGNSSIVIPDIKKLDGTLKAFTILIRLQVTNVDRNPTVQEPFWTTFNFLTWHRNTADSEQAFMRSKMRTAWQPGASATTNNKLSLGYIMEWCNISQTASGYNKDSAAVMNKWHTIAYVYNAGTMKIYHNCKIENNWDGIYPKESALCGSDPVQISLGNVPLGVYKYGYRYFKGKIDDLRIYTRALTEEEVKWYADTLCVEDPEVRIAVNRDACRPSVADFTDISIMTGRRFHRRVWEINGTAMDTAKSFKHAFTTTGNYWVKLTVFTDSPTSFTHDTLVVVGSTGYVRFMYPADTAIAVCAGSTVAYNINTDAAIKWETCTYLSACDSKTVTITPLNAITYKIKGTNADGCIDSTMLKVQVIANDEKVYVPNAFTPNGDRLNDQFGPLSRNAIDMIDLKIYNRLGQKIFSSNKQSNKWDGTLKGIPQQAGVYIYTLSSSAGYGCPVKHEKGTVTLIR